MRVLNKLRLIVGLLVAGVLAAIGLPVAFGAVLTTQTPVIMWDKLDQRLAGATPIAQSSFRAFKSWCMQNLRGINLQLVDIGNLGAFVNPVTGAMRVYAVYAKKQATATKSYLNLFDNAANDATAANAALSLPLLEASKEAFVFFPDGLPLASGLVLGAYTTVAGFNAITNSTSGDGPNGFVLVG